MYDQILFARWPEVATKKDFQVANNLLDTLMLHKESCVGMAANMPGARKLLSNFSMRADNLKSILCCSILKLLKKMVLTIPRKTVCHFSLVPINVSAIKQRRCSIRPWNSKHAQQTPPAEWCDYSA